MTLQHLGDQAMLAMLANEAEAAAFAAAVRAAGWPWLQDVVPAYATAGVFYDMDKIRSAEVRQALEGLTYSVEAALPGKMHRVPVCYDLHLDMPRVTAAIGLTTDDVIRLHTAAEFTVYAIGFVPGFPYLGYLPAELSGVARLESPRVLVEPGSVGITGRQTGIYPLARPGGWNLIGRTPLTIVDVEAGFFPIRVGDRVRFERIDEAEFHHRHGERLETP